MRNTRLLFRSQVTSRLAKLLLASSLAFGAAAVFVPLPGYAAETSAAAKLNTNDQAMDRAIALKLMPADATVTNIVKRSDQWEIVFKTDEKDKEGKDRRFGEVVLGASNGEVIRFHDRLNLDEYTAYNPENPNPFDESKQKVDFQEAVRIADEFVEEQTWQLDDSWMHDFYDRSDYSTRADEPTVHWIRYHRSHEGIRYEANHMYVLVDRITGEVRSYEVFWHSQSFESSKGLPSLQTAAKAVMSSVEPFLGWQDEYNGQKQLVYRTHPFYVMDLSGKLPASENLETPVFSEKIKPQYPSRLAKLRLLSLYELEPVYKYGSGDAKLYYQLSIKPGVPRDYPGTHPSIHANTGQWLNLSGEPVTEPFPPVADWLIDQAAPSGKVGYSAAIVWNYDLLQLQNEPMIRNGYTLVPFRELLTKLGAAITWDPANRKIGTSKDGVSIELTADSNTVYVNGKAQKLEAPARISGGRTYIPARLVLETFGAKVSWDAASRLVVVATDDGTSVLTAEQLEQLRFQAQLNWEAKNTK
ncbi:copper amine oxidase N-terminal domain-containing protein [Paenibacillus soyae]|uniref:Copper amine oxidase N-terminal domain-containing protein n=1 Tax=Paenibacillus soyae TaxID=2969249 RepID=A0A9X2MXY4_9BACL|nr:copper amine oxidase N-terminal domain-containing protein [Paenibacillus soyae]MCR2807901.1 copper amine oxidase N-terminal domain-containing protein [Paenibacillus soyae]